MSIKLKENVYGEISPQILAIPDHYVALGFLHKAANNGSASYVTDVDGRKIIKAGSIFPSNDAQAKGVVLNNYDVTDGDVNIAVVIHGFVLKDLLPAVPQQTAIDALKQISFVDKVTGR